MAQEEENTLRFGLLQWSFIFEVDARAELGRYPQPTHSQNTPITPKLTSPFHHHLNPPSHNPTSQRRRPLNPPKPSLRRHKPCLSIFHPNTPLHPTKAPLRCRRRLPTHLRRRR